MEFKELFRYISLFINSMPLENSEKLLNQVVPKPEPQHGYPKYLEGRYDHVNNIENRVGNINIESDQNIWEFSGLYEGDILLHDRNGVILDQIRWPNSTVPYYIEEDDFTTKEIIVILEAMQEYHNNSCIRFRKKKKSDKNWIHFRGEKTGCWSLVGCHDGGQVVNLQVPSCVQRGVVIHELLHAMGFFHQQSASDRDDYVNILWENIQDGREHNFNKYNNSIVTDYGYGYDYQSVMHYSGKAFSKNGKPTIEALQPNITFGQRKGFSEKDLLKLNSMYQETCRSDQVELGGPHEQADEDWFQLIDLLELFRSLRSK